MVNKRYLPKDHICWKTLLLVNKPKDGLPASRGRGKKTVKDLEQEKRCTTERYTGAAVALLERHHCTQEAQERCKVDTVPERREVCLSAKSWPAGQGWGGKEEGTAIGDFLASDFDG